MKSDKLSELTIGCAIEVHRELGPGLLESTSERCLAQELGLTVPRHKTQCPLPVEPKGVHFDCGYRSDPLGFLELCGWAALGALLPA